jgi:Holliday junction DNA helicase RuvA
MITHLEGRLAGKEPTRIVVDVGGVGYEVFVPLSCHDRLPGVGERCRILVCEHIREDAHQLFGFTSEAERRVYLLLTSVNGIGPKLALSALSGMSSRELTAAIVQGDVKRLSSLSGIGRRLAERMVVELKGRIGEADALEAVAGAEDAPETAAVKDAVLALIALGYRQDEARRMVRDALAGTPGRGREELVRRALAGAPGSKE